MNKTGIDRKESDQELFWAGDFGDEYADRNQSKNLLASNLNFFSRIIDRCNNVNTILELGANVGMNLRALLALLPDSRISAVEINKKAVAELEKWGGCHEVIHESLLDFIPKSKYDFVLIKGVMIHLDPSQLERAYKVAAQATGRYLCIAEYYNPSPMEVVYRGHTGKLFKRDFAGEFLRMQPNFKLVDYGFCYRNDPVFPQDDITWFLLEAGGE